MIVVAGKNDWHNWEANNLHSAVFLDSLDCVSTQLQDKTNKSKKFKSSQDFCQFADVLRRIVKVEGEAGDSLITWDARRAGGRERTLSQGGGPSAHWPAEKLEGVGRSGAGKQRGHSGGRSGGALVLHIEIEPRMPEQHAEAQFVRAAQAKCHAAWG
ncbi:hypothetical protein K438DRAFT_1787389 [Mycena galopus ATCC 62051]|nr:hypothetical protein K438DRAFT_1787389 [Mycena galopus ATCC 62051]